MAFTTIDLVLGLLVILVLLVILYIIENPESSGIFFLNIRGFVHKYVKRRKKKEKKKVIKNKDDKELDDIVMEQIEYIQLIDEDYWKKKDKAEKKLAEYLERY